MPRAPKPAPPSPSLPSPTLIIDNGAYTMKAGFAPTSPPPSTTESLKNCHIIPNALCRTRDKRTYVGAQLLSHISDWGEATFRRPVERGCIVNWDAEREIWEHTFFDEKTARKELRVKDAGETTLVLTEAGNAMAALGRNVDEIVMEEWGFGAYGRCVGPSLNAWNDVHPLLGDPVKAQTDNSILPVECLLVIDSGYSHTTVTPIYNGRLLHRAIRRLEVGGKFLTNFLKELVSVRHYDLHQEIYQVNEMKEEVCFVSNDFSADMEKTWKGNKKRNAEDGIVVDYVLPDYATIKKGFMRPHDPLLAAKIRKAGLDGGRGPSEVVEQVMTLGNERFTVPELLFNPGDIGLKQAGIAEVVMQSLSVLPTGLHPVMLANVLVVGGNAMMKGFVERLETELRQIAPAECVVRVRKPDDPIRSTWLGGARLASNPDALKEVVITKQQYHEHGSAWVGKKFAGGTAK